MSPEDENQEQTDANPFSIRQYTLSCRQKNIFHCWPFPEKYLHLCLKHGVTDVLPPLEHHCDVIQSLEDVNFNCMQKDNKDPVVISHNVSDMLGLKNQALTTVPCSCLNVDSQPILSLNYSERSRKKHKRRKGKRKKRSMVDILAVAKPCTLDDLYKINRENTGTNISVENGLRGSKQTVIFNHGCNANVVEDCSNQKLEIDDHEEGYPNLLGQSRWVLKGQIHRLQIQFIKLKEEPKKITYNKRLTKLADSCTLKLATIKGLNTYGHQLSDEMLRVATAEEDRS